MLIRDWLTGRNRQQGTRIGTCRSRRAAKSFRRRQPLAAAVVGIHVETLEERVLLTEGLSVGWMPSRQLPCVESPGDAAAAPSAAAAVGGNSVSRLFRAYNPNADYHFFTTSRAEFDNAVAHGYRDEATGQTGFAVPAAPSDKAATIYRLYNLQTGRHYYTFNAGERDFLVSIVPPPATGPDTRTVGWRYEKDEGFIFTTHVLGTAEIFRLYNNNSGVHLYTENGAYKNQVLALFPGIWVQHSSFGFANPVSSPRTPGGTMINPRPPFIWSAVAGASSYDVSVDDLTTGQSPVLQQNQAGTSWFASTALTPGHNYRWQVRATVDGTASSWSAPQDFTLVAAPPLSLITVGGAAFNPAAETHVVFTDSTGRQTKVFATNVTTTQVEVAVPPAEDPVTFASKPETYTVSVVQQTPQGPTNSGPLMNLQVTGFPVIPGSPPGKVISLYLQQAIDMVDTVITDYQNISTATGGVVNVTSLVSGLQKQRQDLTSSLQLIKPLVDGTVQQVNLGTVSGRTVVLIRGTAAASSANAGVMPASCISCIPETQDGPVTISIPLTTLDQGVVPFLGTGAPDTIQSGGIPGPGAPPPSPVERMADVLKDFMLGNATEIERVGREGQESAEKVSGLLEKFGFTLGIDFSFASTYTRAVATILRKQWNNLEDPKTAEIEVKKALATQLFDELGHAGWDKLGEQAEDQFKELAKIVPAGSVLKNLVDYKIGGVQGLVEAVAVSTVSLKNQFLQNYNQIVTGLQDLLHPKPVMSVSPAALTFTATENGPAPAAKTYTVSNTGPAASRLHFNSSTGIGRVQISGVQPAALAGGEFATFSVAVDISGLPAGTSRQQVITVTNLDANTTQSVTVSYTVTAPANPFAGSYTGSFSGTASAFGFTFPTSGPVAFTVDANGHLSITVPSGGGQGTVTPSGNATFAGAGGFGSNGDANYSFSGTFVAAPSGAVTASGGWSATFTGGSGSGGWTATRSGTASSQAASASLMASPVAAQAVSRGGTVAKTALDDFWEKFGADDPTLHELIV